MEKEGKKKGWRKKQRGNKRENEGMGESGGSGKWGFEISAPFIFPVDYYNQELLRMTNERCRQVQSLGLQLWFL